MATSKDNKPGPFPGRQTEVPNAGPEFDARHDLDRQKRMPASVRDRIDEGDLPDEPRGTSKASDHRDLSGPKGAAQEREHHKRGGGS